MDRKNQTTPTGYYRERYHQALEALERVSAAESHLWGQVRALEERLFEAEAELDHIKGLDGDRHRVSGR